MIKAKSFLLSFFVFCFLFSVCVFAQEPQDKIWEFGNVKQGEPVTRAFVFKNETNAPLKIKSSHASCGCTAVMVKKDALLANESTDVEVTFKPKGYKGEVTQYVYIETDNVDNPTMKYTVKINVME